MAMILDLLRTVWRLPLNARAWFIGLAKDRLVDRARHATATIHSASTMLFVPVCPRGWAERAAADELIHEGTVSMWPDGVLRIAVDRDPFRSARAAIRP